MSRAEHLQWAKDRALDLAKAGDMQGAFTSLLSDLGKHPETEKAQELAATLGLGLFVGGHLTRFNDMKNFIEGFN